MRFIVLLFTLITSLNAGMSVTIPASACADGTVNTLLPQKYFEVSINGGGEILFEGDCPTLSALLVMTVPSEVRVVLKPKFGGMMRFTCTSCNNILTFGMDGIVNYGVEIENAIFDLTNASNSSSYALVLNNIVRPKLKNVIFANSTSRYRTDGLVLKNGFVSPLGLCNVPGGSGPCLTANAEINAVWTGIFTNGLVTFPSNPNSNGNFSDIHVNGGYANLAGSGVGFNVSGATRFVIERTKVNNGTKGFSMRGSNHLLLNTGSYGNTQIGVALEDTPGSDGSSRAYANTVENGSHPDGVTRCLDCNMINTTTGSVAQTFRSGVRTISSADPQSYCTTQGSIGSTCAYTVNIVPSFPPGVTNYTAQCQPIGLSGSPAISINANTKTSASFVVTTTAGSNVPASAKVDCRLELPGNQ